MPPLNERLRIALLTGSLGVGGAEKQLLYAAKTLRDTGADVFVFSFDPDGFYKRILEEASIPVICIKPRNRLSRLASLFYHLNRFRPHIIQTGQLYTGMYAGIIGKLIRACSIVNMRNELAYEKRIGHQMLLLSIRTPTALIANSHNAVNEVVDAQFTSRDRVYWLGNAIKLEDYDQPLHALDYLPAGIRVAFVGRLAAQKRVDRFLKAIALAHKQESQIVGIIVGDGPDAVELRAQADKLENPVVFLGMHDDIPQILRNCHMLILCSDYEGFPNVIIEAMAARLPVITTPAGDSDQVAVDGETGYIVGFDDIEAIASKIVLLAQDATLREKMGQIGRTRAETLYSYDKLAEHLFDIYADIGQKKHDQHLLNALQQATTSSLSQT